MKRQTKSKSEKLSSSDKRVITKLAMQSIAGGRIPKGTKDAIKKAVRLKVKTCSLAFAVKALDKYSGHF